MTNASNDAGPDVIDLSEIWLALDFPDECVNGDPEHLADDFVEPLPEPGESSYRSPAPFMQGA
jgi:hypothetical protein